MTTPRTELGHHLVVEECDGEFDRWIEHKPECPKEIVDVGPLLGQVWEEYTCGTGYWGSIYGLDELADDPRFTTTGRHAISFYSYTPDSFFEDHEAYLEYDDAPR